MNLKYQGGFFQQEKENNVEFYTIKSGVGKINCSSATQLVIDKYLPDFVIDAGVAGSLTEDVNVNDIVCGKYIFEYDPNTGEILDKNTPFTWSLISQVIYRKEFDKFVNWAKETKNICIKIGNIATGEKDVKSMAMELNINPSRKASGGMAAAQGD